MKHVCPTCGRPYAPKLSVSGPVRQRLVKVLLKFPEGVEMGDLINLIYAVNPNGAPPSARQCISVLAHYANEQLGPQGWVITATKGRGSRYRIVQL